MTSPGVPHVITLDSTGLGDRSYVVHDGRTALVVDPQRDIDRVEHLIAEHGLRITHVVETHFHNDYVSGGLELARKHGAEYVVPSGFDIAFAATQVDDGDNFMVGDVAVEVIHTPGHTPNSMSYAASIGDNTVVFTGGGLLYGSVGRPDLVAPDLTVKQTHDQWHSAHRLAGKLGDETAVFPTHGFGSFCSATQTQGVSSTIGHEKTINPALKESEQSFVEMTLAGLDVFPAYYAHMGPANVAGAANVDLSQPVRVDPDEVRDRIARGEWIVDLRSREVFAAGHVPGSVNFDLDGSFINYLAWMMPWGTPVTLLGATPEQVAQAQRELVRVGIDQLSGAAVGGPDFWLADPAQAATLRRLSFQDLASEIATETAAYIIDTRQILEWESGHVEGAHFIPFYEIADRLAEIPRDRPVYVYCGSGYRAAAVVSLLQQEGIHNAVLVDDDFGNAATAGLSIVTEQTPGREPGWTWIASRGVARTYAPRSGADARA
ncbi:MAG: rhodanese-like domain-containing protein [Candidatus Nanopelagicales bacterium]|jgi:hydroxyacylglutathione hydrolase|nr:rhodanese-like domain-containing protein [Candidatus Nanopelagicales bacterium]MDP4976092.1 rhodanese-like domain-containing protein [Candidatus Nanopelagicales bacterium]MDP5094723.1 rhodanese-like domain-containing protein [Candidatus Nanopelagicales bacterium]